MTHIPIDFPESDPGTVPAAEQPGSEADNPLHAERLVFTSVRSVRLLPESLGLTARNRNADKPR
jgi:hypothetical protein